MILWRMTVEKRLFRTDGKHHWSIHIQCSYGCPTYCGDSNNGNAVPAKMFRPNLLAGIEYGDFLTGL